MIIKGVRFVSDRLRIQNIRMHRIRFTNYRIIYQSFLTISPTILSITNRFGNLY
jgi:mRNA-degrading endonuclease RelE of RelBE toxin-antitoxin system